MLLVKPYLGCNRHCAYCFEGDWRNDTRPAMDYDIDKVLQAMHDNLNGARIACLHGGEPLMLPKDDIDRILQKGHQLTGRTAIQTNGFLMDDDHLAIFKRYHTGVGVSYDGFGDLNKARMNESEADEIWQKVLKLIEEGIRTSIIVVVSRANAGSKDKLKRLEQFLIEAKKQGVVGGRLNSCDHPDWILPVGKLREVYRNLALFVMENNIRWGPFTDMWNSLRHQGPVVCVFRGCNPLNTQAATVILGDGSVANCIKMSIKNDFERKDNPNPRTKELLTKAQDKGGCAECAWWNYCHGGCPAQGIDDDWQNRSIFCPIYKEIFPLYRSIQTWQQLPSTLPPSLRGKVR